MAMNGIPCIFWHIQYLESAWHVSSWSWHIGHPRWLAVSFDVDGLRNNTRNVTCLHQDLSVEQWS